MSIDDNLQVYDFSLGFSENDSLLQNLQRIGKVGYWKIDVSEQVCLCSDYIVELLTLRSSNVLLETIYSTVREDYRDSAISFFQLLGNGDSEECVFPVLSKDGYIWISVKLNNRVQTKEGKLFLDGFLEFIGKVVETELYTPHSSVEKKNFEPIFNGALEVEKQFRLIADFAGIGIYQWNVSDNRISASNTWFNNLNKTSTQVNDFADLLVDMDVEDRSRMNRLLQEIRSNEKEQFIADFRFKDDNSYRWLKFTGKMCKNGTSDRDQGSIVGLNFDITERKLIEENLIEAKKKAEESDRLKSGFLANMSHEIRTPLNAIVGFSNLLSETDLKEERAQYISIIQKNSVLLLQLISDVLDLSKIESGMIAIQKEEFEIDDLCEDVIRLQLSKKQSHVSLQFDTDPSKCLIVSDKKRIVQILSNLVDNAFKFTEYGSVKIGYHIIENDLEFYVRDTGIGIEADQIDHIFERFVKLDTFSPGTGLGLSICKSIVEKMGGIIWVESVLGEGSCFKFKIPGIDIRQEEVKASVATAIVPGKHRERKVRPLVLVAEDTDSNYLLVSSILKKEYDLLRANNGFEAVHKYLEQAPDIILMDVKMPEMDGLTATQKIRAMNSDIPIIALTAFAYDSDRQNALDAGCNDYMSKPINGDALRDMIEKWL